MLTKQVETLKDEIRRLGGDAALYKAKQALEGRSRGAEPMKEGMDEEEEEEEEEQETLKAEISTLGGRVQT